MKDKRIGILTFHKGRNYGAALQCFALQEVVKDLGYHPIEIDYVPRMIKKTYNTLFWSRCIPIHPSETIEYLKSAPKRARRNRIFGSFVKRYFCLSDKSRLGYLSQDFDTVIIGSDQVWNPNNSLGKYDTYYWGCFKSGVSPRIISYAASMGGSWKNSDWNKINGLLHNFDAISVREDYLRDIINERTDSHAEWVLDPTLLQTREFWMSHAADVRINVPYLLYYQARRNDAAFEYAKRIAIKKKLEFICVSADVKLYNSYIAIDAGPAEFLGLFKNATYVVTSSFHGTVFCYHFKKDFCSLQLGDGEDGRSSSLLSLLGLEDHLVTLDNEPTEFSVDWHECDCRLDAMRESSRKWLQNNI